MGVNQYEDTLDTVTDDQQDPYAATLRQLNQAPATNLRIVQQTQQTSPDRAADVLRFSESSGLPPDVVDRNLDAMKARASVDETPQALLQRDTPALVDWLTQQPMHHAVAQDDLQNLGLLEWLTKAPARAWQRGQASVELGKLRTASLFRDLTADEQGQVQSLKASLASGGTLGTEGHWFKGAITGAAEQLPMLWGATLQGAKLGIPAGVTAGTGGFLMGPGAPIGVPALFGAGLTAGMTAGAATFGFETTAGLAYDEYLGLKDELGRPIDPGVAKAAAIATGAINAGIQTFGLEKILETIPGAKQLIGAGSQATVAAALRSPTVRAALADVMRTTGKTLTITSAALVAQRAVQILGGEIGKVASGATPEVATPEGRQAIAQDLAHSAVDAVQSFALISAAGPTLGLPGKILQAKDAQHNATFFQALGETASQSKTIQRSPEAVQAFLAQATKDGPLETVYAPIDTWTTYWQGKGISPADMATKLTGNPDAYETAVRTGEDLAIPTAAYAVQIAPTEHNAFFQNEWRLAPEQMNAREAQDFEAKLSKESAIVPGEQASPTEPIRQAITSQLEAAGFERSTAETYAQFYEAVFGSLGRRAGLNPVDLFNRYGLKISREGLAAVEEGQAANAVDSIPGGVQHGATDVSGTSEPRAEIGETGRSAVSRVTASVAPARESPTQYAARREQHYADVFDAVLSHAQRLDPTVDPAALRAEFDTRVSLLEDLDQEYRAGGHNPRTLLQAIATHGGISVAAEGRYGYAGELRWVKESPALGPYGAFGGVRGVFRTISKDARGVAATGLSLDDMVRRLSQDPRFTHIQSIDDLLAALQDVARLTDAEKGGTLPGTRELARQAGMAPDRAWWQPAASIDNISDEDISFNPSEFNQGPKPNLFDTLDTGEQQARLPEAGDVRDLNTPTPTFEAPFALTPPENKGEKGKQSSLFQGERGRLRFGADRQFNIELLQHADLSTFVHESGHFFLEVLHDLANEPQAAESIKADMATLDAWLADEDHTGPGFSTQQHEQFARGFEAYLLEGKAPSAELRGVFARMRAWLVGVYRSLTNLHVTLNDDVRQVFDRLLASDDAIQQAQSEADIRPLFTDAASAGMTPEQFAQYRDVVASASEKARIELQTKVLRDVQRERESWWQTERDGMRAKVAAQLGEEPVYRALAAIRKGERPDGSPLIDGQKPEPLKLAKADLVGRYTPEQLTALRKFQLYSAEGGTSPDVVAQFTGFSSGDELIQALLATGSFKDAVDAETDRRMVAAHGDLLLDGRLAEQADQAVNGEHRQAVVRAELKALTSAMVKGTIPPMSAIKAAAVREIGGKRVRDLRPGLYLQAAKRASQRAFDLLSTNQDRTGAVEAKQQELINLARYREATDAQEFADKARAYLGPYFDRGQTRERIGKAGGDYLDQIDALRNRFDFARVTNATIDRRASLADFAARELAQGHELAIDPAILQEARSRNWRDVSIDELRGVYDAAKSIEHWARFKNKLLRNQAQRDLVALAGEGATSIATYAKRTGPVALEPRVPGTQAKRDVQGWLIAHRPLLAILRQLDGFRDGFLFDQVWRPAHEARTAESIASHEAAERWAAIHEARFKGEEAGLYATTYIPALKNSLSTAARLAVALNAGNEGNRERLRAAGIGNTGPLSAETITAILDTLTPRDWTYVRDTATLINSYKGQIGELYKRVTGVAPAWVEPVPFHTAAGEQPGWYYPIAYEGRASARALPGPEATFADIVGKSSYMRFQTANGHTEARAAHTGIPLRADLGVVGEHLQQVVHDLTHREMLIDVGRLLGRPEMQDAIYRHYGDQYYREIQGAFRDVAIGPLPAPDWYRIVAPLRRGAAMARLAWNFATITRHVTNITNGMVRVGAGDVLAAIPRWLGSAKDAENSAGWIGEQSALMAGRWNHRMEELTSIKADIGLNRGPWAATLRDAVTKVGIDPDLTHRFADSYLYGVHKIIQMAEIPSWIAAYQQAVRGGDDHARAVARADHAILDAFGGGDTLDLAGVQRSYSGKLFTTFMTYSLTLHRQNYEILSRDTSISRKVVDAALLNVVPVVLLSAIFQQVHKKDSLGWEVAEELFAHATGMFVFAREVSGALTHPDYTGPSSLAPFGTASRIIFNTAHGLKDESTKKLAAAAKGAGELAGQFYGVPVYQVERTAAGITALLEGKTHDLSALLYGPPTKGRR